ncbi:anti-sigma U factor RsuA [Kutzneria viridogrisea]|uniref:Putative zinc-finger domain-containing protein n=2 Tax=Kutzneria TaxID=43356 RepID=W5W1H2_9PSEU|nr:zf-HC2 domain-containing protein [Kutzneria albida]AHH94667.1 hypothetical protein KALB_1294 [Kutzneria albida DSM 43870]MBA8930335.1 hypothetical protein [Kutzneria viridogrisea]
MSSPADHVDVAAYVLGALDEPEQSAFERHLAGCARCQAELDELSGMPALLDQVRDSGLLADLLVQPPPAPAPPRQLEAVPPPQDKVLRGVLTDIASARRRRKRLGVLAAAAAAVLIIGGPIAVIGFNGGFGGSGAEVVAASNPANNVSAKLSLTAAKWGTKVAVDLSGVRGPLNCVLYAVDHKGTKYPVGSWTVDSTGYGVPGSPDPLHFDGSTAVQRSDIARFEFARENGPDILVVGA